jgi:hypothetical protein
MITRREIIKQGGLALTSLAISSPLIEFTKYNKMISS